MGLNCFSFSKVSTNKKSSNLKGCKKKRRKDKLKESVIQNNHQTSTKRFTQGPLDGNLYAIVNKSNSDLNTSLNNRSNNTESIYTNLNATSIDSGISSSLGEQNLAGNKSIYSTIKYSPDIKNKQRLKNQQQNEISPSLNQSLKSSSVKSSVRNTPSVERNTQNNKTSPEPDYLDRLDLQLISLIEKLDNQKKQSMPKTSEEAELDDLLSDMLLELQSTDNQTLNLNKSNKSSEQMLESNQSRQPLSGGGRLLSDSLDGEQPASPRFLKKPNYDGGVTSSSSAPAQQPFSYGIQNASPALQRRRLHSEKTAYVSESDPNDEQNRKSLNDRRSEENLISILKEQALEDRELNRQASLNSSIVSDGAVINGTEDLDWLERQKLKLKNRKEGDLWRDRFNKERSLMQELRTAVRPKQQSLNESVNSQQFDQPLHIETNLNSSANQSINIPIKRTNALNQGYQRSQSANYDNRNSLGNSEFRTIHTKKKTMQRDSNNQDQLDSPRVSYQPVQRRAENRSGSNTPVRSQSPSPSISSLKKEQVHATNLPVKKERQIIVKQEEQPSSPVYIPCYLMKSKAPVSPTPSNASTKQTVDENDLNELIRTASSPVYAYSKLNLRPVSRQSDIQTPEPQKIQHQHQQQQYSNQQQPIYQQYHPQLYSGYQSTPIRCTADLPDCDNPQLPNPRWSPISGSYLKRNYPNERCNTPLFPISTPNRACTEQFTFDNNGTQSSTEVNNNTIKHDYNNSSQSSSPAMSTPTANERIIYPETYLKIKREQQEQDRLAHLNKNSTLKPNSSSNQKSEPFNQLNSSSSPINQLNTYAKFNSNNNNSTQTKLNQSYESTNLDEDQSTYLNQSERSSFVSNLDDREVIDTNPKFIQSCSQYWYRPTIGRDEAIKILLNKPPGSFIVRDSESFKGSFGLAIRVSQAIADMQPKSYGKGQTDLVRHFLIEPTTKGVRIKGCSNEPVFSSLSALIYQHTTTQLALPIKLILPEIEPVQTLSLKDSQLANQIQHQQLMASGAACNVLYLLSIDTESLTGPEAIRKACTVFLREFNKKLGIKEPEELDDTVELRRGGSKRESKRSKGKSKVNQPQKFDEIDHQINPVENAKVEPKKIDPDINGIVVYFKVSSKGISLTDNSHRHFFRKHFTIQSISHCGLDPEDRKFQPYNMPNKCRFFGFVSRAPVNINANNQTHLFADLEKEQPASAIISFINKVMLSVSSNRFRQF